MPYTITRQGDAPILLVEISDPFDFRTDQPTIRAKIFTLFNDITRPFFVIYDIRDLSVTFNDVVAALADTIYTRDDTQGIFQKYGRILVVGSGPLISLGIESTNRFLSSGGQARAFDTLKEALEYARLQVVDPD